MPPFDSTDLFRDSDVSSWRPVRGSNTTHAASLLSAAATLALHAPEQRLCDSAFFGDAQSVQALLEQWPEINLTHPDRYKRAHSGFALGIAAMRDHLNCVRLLLTAHPASALHTGEQGHTPLMLAAANGSLPCLLALLPHSDTRARQVDGWDALRLAIHAQSPDCIRALLPHSDLTQLDARGAHALSAAAQFGDRVCLDLLLAHLQASPSGVPQAAALHALQLAVRRQHWACADRLIAHVPSERVAPLLNSAILVHLPYWVARQEREALHALLFDSTPALPATPPGADSQAPLL